MLSVMEYTNKLLVSVDMIISAIDLYWLSTEARKQDFVSLLHANGNYRSFTEVFIVVTLYAYMSSYITSESDEYE